MTDWPHGYDRLILEEIDGTNAEAARLAVRGPRRPVWILARRQTRGRGRRGREWTTEPGNLAATLLAFPTCGVREAGFRSFVAALAVADLLAALAVSDIGFKWPNDVLLKGGKAAGILLESAGGSLNLDWLAVGIGVNLVAAPEAAISEIAARGAPRPVSVVGVGGRRVTPERALTILASAWDRWERRLMQEGFEPVRAAWLAHAERLGKTVETRLNGVSRTGVFKDVDATGALVLGTSTGVERIAAADVFFPG